MIHRVKLYVRLSDNGKFSRKGIEYRNGRPVPPTGHVTGYLIRKAGKFEHVGKDLEVAFVRLRQEEAKLSGEVIPAAPTAPVQRARIADTVAGWKNELRAAGKAKSTLEGYFKSADDFVAQCTKTYLDEIDRKDILTHMSWLRENLESRVPGSQAVTLCNRLKHLRVFFGKQGIQLFKVKNTPASAPGLLFHDDRPKQLKKKPRKYNPATVDQLLQAADEDQKDYLLFLLWSGFRDGEVQHLQYSDFDWRSEKVTCTAKPHFAWKPKDHEERTVDLPSEVIARMKRRTERLQTYTNGYRKPTENDLVFPSATGLVDDHLIDRLHDVAAKVGISLVGQKAGHMFRKTAGSRVAKRLGLRAAMNFLGHSKLETTASYLAADDDSKKTHEVYNEMYAAGD